MANKNTVSQYKEVEINKKESNTPHEEIRSEAYKIYLKRMNKRLLGTAEHDWQNAITDLRKKKIFDILSWINWPYTSTSI